MSAKVLARWRSGVLAGGQWGRKVLGGSLLVLGVFVLTGVDKVLEAFAVELLPAWTLTL